jgi:tetratricopeptide (TPR) repeat protein
MSKSNLSGISAQQRELLLLGVRAHRAGDLATAERFYRKLNKAAPHDLNGPMLLGALYAQSRRFDDAERFLAQAVAISPNPEALNNYGAVLVELGRLPEAIGRLQQAVRAKPDYAEAHFNLANALRRSDQTEQAIASFRTALSLRPGYVEALQNLSDALREAGQYREAIDSLRQAITLRPGNAILQNNIGIALREAGDLDEARKAFDRAIALDGNLVHAYYHRVRTGKVIPGDAMISAMEQLKARGHRQTGEECVMLGFGLAKAYDDTGEYDKAFANLLEANGGARALVAYDEAAELREFDRLETKFSAPFIAARGGAGVSSELPIFVVGFPRSGTTLTEQILASHPAVHGAGEILILPEVVYGGGAGPLLDGAAEDDMNVLQRLGALYVERLARLAPDAARITDKNPGNGPLIGLLHLMLPKARVIYVSRNPLDTCVSCFLQRFAGNSSSYAYDLGELGRRYRRYSEIMEHWQRALPAGSILFVRYESLVANFEPEVRRILDYCGLSWDDRCLEFHQASRSVLTASATQVRQPLYASSIGRWRRYEKHLDPLIKALGQDPALPV